MLHTSGSSPLHSGRSPSGSPAAMTKSLSTQVSVVPAGATASAMASTCCCQVKSGRRADGVEGAGRALLEQRHHPGGHVADVDDLRRRVLRARGPAPRRRGPAAPPTTGSARCSRPARRRTSAGRAACPGPCRSTAARSQSTLRPPYVSLVTSSTRRVVELGQRRVLGDARARPARRTPRRWTPAGGGRRARRARRPATAPAAGRRRRCRRSRPTRRPPAPTGRCRGRRAGARRRGTGRRRCGRGGTG